MTKPFTVKTYIVTKADRDGNLIGEPIAAKLTFSAAHAIAKAHAPAKVTPMLADKTDDPNGPAFPAYHLPCN